MPDWVTRRQPTLPKEIEGEYGIQHLYTIEVEGRRDKLYATPALHHKLQEAGLGPGQVVTITKVEAEGNRKEWQVEVQPRSQAPQVGPEKGNGQPAAAQPVPGNGTPAQAPPDAAPGPSPEFVALTQAMQYCLATAYEVWEGLEVELPFTAEDVRTVGITLFLECSRRGVVPQVVEKGLPF